MESTTPVAAAAAGKAFKVDRSRVGRGIPDITAMYNKKCSCRREKATVFCRACGYYCHGRVRLKCEIHPRITFLLDINECPRCHSSAFLDEFCY
nr:uncharacterized protein CG13380 [Maniola hyperantus]